MDKERFSLLLLEPNEIYFEDFLVDLIDENDDQTSTKANVAEVNNSHLYGHLKMCSKSIVFDPKDKLDSIIKIAFKDCSRIYHWPGKLDSKYTNVLAVSCRQYAEMLEQNILAPYRFVTKNRLFLFNLRYARVENYLNQLCQLLRASTLSAFEQNDMIATIVYSRCKRVKFNPLWLDDIYEKIISEHIVDEINPLVLNPGRLLLTSNGMYFQPYNNIQPYPVQKIPLKMITSLVKRRYLLRHTGLEINWKENSTNQQLYVCFRNENERNAFYSNVNKQEHFRQIPTEQESMTLKWQNGVISNYDYLLYLNSLADRTFQDLTQYPVFPWIISNYKSEQLDLNDLNNFRDLTKPIGALNVERLERLKERCEEMDDAKFLYGSHYSAPALVLFYLVRKYPQLMLCLQNGRFDHPDRMFNDFEDTYKNCLTNMADFKELIPEFYDIDEKGDFLKNQYKINFGVRHDGITVNDVKLPPWANGSTEEFIKKLRESLESDYVSKNLNHWIDLIFGYKQRGHEALNADNLFHPFCYEGAIDLDKVKDLTERHALEVQISEFGQIPKQLFDKPHVPKLMMTIPDSIQLTDANSYGDITQCDITELKLYDSFQSHKDVINCISIDGNNIFSTGKDGLLKCYNIPEKRQMRSVSICGLPLSSCTKIENTNIIIVGSWDNTIMTYDLDYGRVSNVIPAHDDAVSCISIINEIGALVSGSWDCSVKIWKGFDQTEKLSFRMSDAMIAYLPLEDKISCVHAIFNNDTIYVTIGTFAGDVLFWLIPWRSGKISYNEFTASTPTKTLIKHDNEVTAVSFNVDGSKIASCGLDGSLSICDIKTGMSLFKKSHNYALMCLNWSFNEQYLFVGDQSGKLSVWNMITGSMELDVEAFDDVVSGIAVSKCDRKMAAAGINGKKFCIKIWDF